MRFLSIILIEMSFASAIAIVLFWWDKRVARKNAKPTRDRTSASTPPRGAATRHRRVAERTLLIVSLLGGWPGAWWASQTFRHKSQKRSFRIPFWIAAALNLAIIAFILSQVP